MCLVSADKINVFFKNLFSFISDVSQAGYLSCFHQHLSWFDHLNRLQLGAVPNCFITQTPSFWVLFMSAARKASFKIMNKNSFQVDLYQTYRLNQE